jgi:hypothetical protein
MLLFRLQNNFWSNSRLQNNVFLFVLLLKAEVYANMPSHVIALHVTEDDFKINKFVLFYLKFRHSVDNLTVSLDFICQVFAFLFVFPVYILEDVSMEMMVMIHDLFNELFSIKLVVQNRKIK